MGSLAILIAGILLAVPPETGRTLPLRLERGQEFVYHTRHIPPASRPGVIEDQWLDTYVLILDATTEGKAQAAFMTVQRVRAGAETVRVARLELGSIDETGRVTLNAISSAPRLPIEAVPTLETYPFLELPPSIPENGRPWQTTDPETGPVTWQHLHFEQRDRGRCLKLRGEQTSGSPNHAGMLSWQRTETVWVLYREGFVDHAQRETKWRTASGEEYKSTTIIDLDSPPEAMGSGAFSNRKFEIGRAVQLSKKLADLTKSSVEPNDRRFDELLREIDRHEDRGTPYGLAIKSLRRRTELARQGIRPPEPVIVRVEQQQPASAADVGQAAPDVNLRDISSSAEHSLASLRGKPTVLVFFDATASADDHVIRYLRAATKSYAGRVNVLPLMLGGSAAEAQRLGMEPAVYQGSSVLAGFRATTPRAIVLDCDGVIRLIAQGWGTDYPNLLHRELVKIIEGKSK
jgi:hypothetical protein